jgi:hypothetical protein
MATLYTLALENQTPLVWTFVVYILLPEGGDSVAWRLEPVAREGGKGTIAWTAELCVAIGTREMVGGGVFYRDTLARPTSADDAWRIEISSGAQDLVPVGRSLTPGTVQVGNASGRLANAALGIGGTGAVFVPDLFSGATAVFYPLPSYFLLLADAMQSGQLIATGGSDRLMAATTTIVGPRALDLSPAVPSLTVTAKTMGATIEILVRNG